MVEFQGRQYTLNQQQATYEEMDSLLAIGYFYLKAGAEGLERER